MSEMAPERQGGGFSLTKRYGPLPAWAWGLLGGVAVYAGYRFWQNRKAAGSAGTAATTADTSTQGIDYGPELATIQAEIQQLQGAKSTPGPPGPQGAPGLQGTQGPPGTDNDNTGAPPPIREPGPQTVTVPNVVGQRVAFAIDRLESLGLKARPTNPLRNPRNEYVVSRQVPAAGQKVRKGSNVILTVRAVPARRPRPRQPAQFPGGVFSR